MVALRMGDVWTWLGPLAGGVAALVGAAWATWLGHSRRVKAELFVKWMPVLRAEVRDRDIDEMDPETIRTVARVAYTAGGVLRYRADLLWDFTWMYVHPLEFAERYPVGYGAPHARTRRAWLQVQIDHTYSIMHEILHFQVQPWWWRLTHWPTEARKRFRRWISEDDFRRDRRRWVRI